MYHVKGMCENLEILIQIEIFFKIVTSPKSISGKYQNSREFGEPEMHFRISKYVKNKKMVIFNKASSKTCPDSRNFRKFRDISSVHRSLNC